MFFNPGHAKKLYKVRKQASQKLRAMADKEFKAQYQAIRQEGIDAGLQGDELKDFIRRFKHKLQLWSIEEYKNSLREIVQKRLQNSTSDNRSVKKPRLEEECGEHYELNLESCESLKGKGQVSSYEYKCSLT